MARMPNLTGEVGPASTTPSVVGGIDTHQEVHVAAVIDAAETVLAIRSFATTRAGYRSLVRWLSSYQVTTVGVEGTGSYGAGICRHLVDAGVIVWEVDRPDRGERRRHGKDDELDAINAARAALYGRRVSIPKSKAGAVEALRVLHGTRKTAVKARRKARQQLQATIVVAPDQLRDPLRQLSRLQLVATCANWRPDPTRADDPLIATRIGLRSLARRILQLGEEIAELDKLIKPLVIELAPQLLQRHGIGVEIAAQMLLTAGDNPDRLRSEASFAMLCGVAPLPASSGKTCRHRLNRGGDRQANSALYLAVISRLRHDPTTRTYLAKKIAQGHTKREAIRCLKRYLAREVYYLLKAAAPSGLNTAVLTADGSSISAHSAGAQPRSTCRSTAPQQSRA